MSTSRTSSRRRRSAGTSAGRCSCPTSQFIRTLVSARLAADVLDVPTVLVARTDALSATLLTSDVDERDREFLTGERTSEGFFRVAPGIEAPIARALAYAPYADLLWCETSTPDLDEAAQFAEAVHAQLPGKLLAYNCSPSFNWKKHLDDAHHRVVPARARRHGLQVPVRDARGLPRGLRLDVRPRAAAMVAEGMSAYVRLQQQRVRARGVRLHGDAAPARGRAQATSTPCSRRSRGGESSTLALKGSTEEAQFETAPAR